MAAALSVFWLSLAVAASGALLGGGRDRPVAKVVRLLQDMKAELERERADDEAVHESLGCWCKTNDREKSKAVVLGLAKIEDLKSSLGEYAARIEELRQGLASARGKLKQDQEALGAAAAIRAQEASAFHGEEKALLETIQACKQALVILSKHHPSLEQLRTVAHSIEALKTMQLAKDSLGKDKMAVLKAFLQQAEDASTSSLRRISGFESYTPQGGQIFGILKQMQEDFEADLTAAQKAEAKAREDYEALRAAKEAELAAGAKQLAQLEQDDAEFREKHVQAYEEFLDTQEQVETDQAFLASLRKRCAETEKEYQVRTAGRLEEIAAVEDAIGYLNSDDAFEVFDKTVSTALLQTAAGVRHSSSHLDRRAALAAAKRALLRSGSSRLMLLAEGARLDAFAEVKAMISKMVEELKRQQAEEVEHRDWCVGELNANERTTADKADAKQDLETQIADLVKTIEGLTKETKAATEAVASMGVQMRKASELREGENADFQQTIADQRITQAILRKAVGRLEQVYSLAQRAGDDPERAGAPHVQLSGTATDPGNGPARFAKYAKNASGNKVVALLETVLADSGKLEAEAHAGEQDAQSAYENFMKDSNAAIAKYQRAIVNMSENRAKAEQDLSMAKGDLGGTMRELEGLHGVLGGLHESCDFLLANFGARQEARATEAEALGEAKAILSGMK